ncbi:MAG: adenosylmethionine decarboxylase [Aigarchaeota archaeon]|nr:adenosylmethionine decarboxylase [Aigarchaeota archaeon]MDW8092221.1 adenosylmethionine decarboxylase [Nitrososphaerota archaeon]
MNEIKRSDDVIVGKHVYGNAYDCDERVLTAEADLKRVVLEAVRMAGMHLIDLKSWRFGGKKGGISVIALICESHVAVHTWPSYRYATIDVYTCGERSDPEVAFKHICDYLKPKRLAHHLADRSSTISLSPPVID